MLASWDKLDDASKKKFIKIIEEQSNRLINLVENMLSVSKLNTKNEEFIYKETDVSTIINTVVAILKNQYKNRTYNINISHNIPTVLVDRDKFQQVMLNLIENASKYSIENTPINVYAGYSDNPNFVSIKVENIGIHIKPEDISKIFTKFSRIDNPLTRRVQGSGLGLYITKNIIDKMGGTISVDSILKDAENALTTFEIKIPVCNVETQAREKCKQ